MNENEEHIVFITQISERKNIQQNLKALTIANSRHKIEHLPPDKLFCALEQHNFIESCKFCRNVPNEKKKT